jgi:hypothetical protein
VHDAFEPVPDSNGAYGYMWWISHIPEVDGPIYMANGFDGQMIFILPGLDLVVVRNGDYVKSECPAIGDPNLFGRYPPSNLIPGQGTRPPEDWNDADFLSPIVAAITGPSADADVFPDAETAPAVRFPDGQATAPCAVSAPTTTTVASTPTTTATAPGARPAVPVRAQPAFTG